MAKYISTEPLPVGVSEAEFQCERDGLTIRGTEYRRAGERLPIAVVSHGIRAWQATVRHYAVALAELGYVAYTFDFCGGCAPGKGKSGGGSTDIAVISLGGKVRATSVDVAGNTFDDEIMKLVRSKFNVAIGLRTAEELKKQVACCKPSTFTSSMEVKGRSLLTGLPQKFTVKTEDLYEAVMPLVEQITVAAHQVLEKTPPELAGDIFTDGIMLTGGGSMLKGLDEYMSQELKVQVRVSPDPINCVALGTAHCLAIGEDLETGFQDATPRLGRR